MKKTFYVHHLDRGPARPINKPWTIRAEDAVDRAVSSSHINMRIVPGIEHVMASVNIGHPLWRA